MPVGKGIPAPLGPASAYEQHIRLAIVRPMLDEVAMRVAAAQETWEDVRQAIAEIPNDPLLDTLSEEAATAHMRKLRAFHIKRWRTEMGRYLGTQVNIFGDGYEQAMAEGIAENVRLIKTIPEKFHVSLMRDITTIQATEPFNRQALRKVLAKDYQSAGYNLRRITRDQTNKAIGQFNHIRQVDSGIDRYMWQTSMDERVRPTHVDNEGKEFSWDAPPPLTGHPGEDIQCRCIALPIIPAKGQATPPPPGVEVPPTASGVSQTTDPVSLVRMSGADKRKQIIEFDDTMEERLRGIEAQRTELVKAMSDEATEASLEALKNQFDSLADQGAEIKRQRLAGVRDMVRHGGPKPKIPHKIGKTFTDIERARIKQAVDQMESVLPKWLNNHEIRFQRVNNTGYRANCFPVTSKSGQTFSRIKVPKDVDVETLVHEMGHAFENSKREILEEVIEHRASRTADDVYQKLKDVTGKNYGSKEITLKDDFADAYMGREYSANWKAASQVPSGNHIQNPRKATEFMYGTEMSSMTLQHWFADPAAFARKDARTFDFLWDLLSRL